LDGKLDTHVTLLVFFHQIWRAREPMRAVAVANPLATSGAQFALKHACSGAAIAAANVDLAQGILMMIASATALAVTGTPAQNSTQFRTLSPPRCCLRDAQACFQWKRRSSNRPIYLKNIGYRGRT